MSALFIKSADGLITSRKQGRVPHEREYSLTLDDGTTTIIRERHMHDRSINDRYIINVYDDNLYNVFVKKL